MTEREYTGDQIFGPDVPSFDVRPPEEERKSLYSPDGSAIEGISDYQYNRARRLEHVLSRIEQSEEVYNRFKPLGYSLRIAWIDSEGKHTQEIDPQLIRAMNGIAITLFNDLKAEGEDALAHELVDQHRPPLDDGEATS